MTVNPGWARKRRHKILLGAFVLLGLLAGAGYAVLKPPMFTSTALVELSASTDDMPSQAVIADSNAVLAPAQQSIHPAVPLSVLRNRIQAKGVTSNILSVTAQGKTAPEAEGVANAVATSYVAYLSSSAGIAMVWPARVLEPAKSATGPSQIGNLLPMGWIGVLAGLLIGAIVALAVGRRA
jgi:capsular polysaccharide biosynthesis protein